MSFIKHALVPDLKIYALLFHGESSPLYILALDEAGAMGIAMGDINRRIKELRMGKEISTYTQFQEYLNHNWGQFFEIELSPDNEEQL